MKEKPEYLYKNKWAKSNFETCFARSLHSARSERVAWWAATALLSYFLAPG